jgi:hypothetical protein
MQYECNTCSNDESRKVDVNLSINNLIPWDTHEDKMLIYTHMHT